MTDNIHDRDNDEVYAPSGDDAVTAHHEASDEQTEHTATGQSNHERASDTVTDTVSKRPRRSTGRNTPRAAKLHEGNDLHGNLGGTEGIIELRLEQQVGQSVQRKEQQRADEAVFDELAAQGFTEDEAERLLYVSDRIANSRERRDEEAVIRRLRFNRWLYEQGKLNEFSA